MPKPSKLDPEPEGAVATQDPKADKAPDSATVATPQKKASPAKTTKKKTTTVKKKTAKKKTAKATAAKAPADKKAADKKGTIDVGSFQIRVRPGSGYAVLYRIMAEQGRFSDSEERIAKLDVKEQKACASLLKTIMVERDDLEELIREDNEYKAYCDRRTAEYKKRAKAGDARAKAILENPRRAVNGKWVGDIREMLSVCNGSSSKGANNRNLGKYSEAKIVFRQFPRMPRRNHKTFVIMIPKKHLNKVNQALKTVFGNESAKDFVPYLDTKLRSVFS